MLAEKPDGEDDTGGQRRVFPARLGAGYAGTRCQRAVSLAKLLPPFGLQDAASEPAWEINSAEVFTLR